jgi:hypothetical protein
MKPPRLKLAHALRFLDAILASAAGSTFDLLLLVLTEGCSIVDKALLLKIVALLAAIVDAAVDEPFVVGERHVPFR